MCKRCPDDHQHQAIEGSAPGHGSRAVISQAYPEDFCCEFAELVCVFFNGGVRAKDRDSPWYLFPCDDTYTGSGLYGLLVEVGDLPPLYEGAQSSSSFAERRDAHETLSSSEQGALPPVSTKDSMQDLLSEQAALPSVSVVGLDQVECEVIELSLIHI